MASVVARAVVLVEFATRMLIETPARVFPVVSVMVPATLV